MTRIAIRDSTDSYNIGFLDNTNGIKYHSADLEVYAQGSAFLDLKYYSKTQIVDVGMRLAYVFREKDYWMTVTSVSRESEYEYQVEARSLSLEALREVRSSYKASRNMTFKEYIDAFDPEHSIRLNVNTISNRSRKLEWTGEDTILARVLSLATKFDAEIEFETELNDDYSLKEFRLNVHALNELGKDRTGIPFRISNSQLKLIKFKSSIDEFYSAIRGTGKDGLTISGFDKKVYDDEKKLLFYTSAGTIYAPQARDKFISITNKKTSDGYIVREFDNTQHETKEALYAYMLGELKKHCEPQIDYTIDGYIDADVNDKVLLIDDKYTTDDLMLTARVNKQKWSLIDKLQGNNRTELSNYVRVYSEIADELITRMNALIEANKVYDVQILTSDGYSFKNGQGSTTLTARVMDGPRDVTNEFSVNWYREDDLIGPDASITVQASSINEKVVYRIIAYKDGIERGRSELTLINVNDGLQGPQGPKGEQGEQGPAGQDGIPGKDGVGLKTTAVVYGLSNSESTQPTSWSTQVPTLTKGSYLWTRTTWAYTDNTTEIGYQKTYIARDGNNGTDGLPGKDGVGISSTTITYATSISGTVQPTSGWSSQVPSVPSGQYLWTKIVWTYTDNTSETGYSVAKMGERGPQGLQGIQGPKGDQGIAGTNGIDGRTSYTHIAYADSADGSVNFSVSDSNRKYIGVYVDFNQTDSTNPSSYQWSLIKGADGQDGADGLPGKPGADGRTPYFHTAYADSADGQLGFSTTNASGKLYLGTCTDYIQSDPTDYRAYTWVKIKGETGQTGPAGRDGKGVKSYKITYQAGTSGVAYPTGNWSSTIPNVPNGQYLWSKTTLTYTDNTTSDTYSVAYFPVNGATGATGNGISSYTAEFYLSTSKTSQSGGSWTTTPPTWSNGKYIWTRYKIGYTNGSTAYTTPHCSSEWEAINEIQVGGRNLLFKTGFFDGDQLSGVVGDGNKINLSKTIIADANSPSGKAYRINKYKKGTENVYGGCYWSMPKKLVSGKKYTWSVYVRGAGTVDAFGPEQGGFKSVKLTNTWTKVSHTFTANSNQYFQFVFYSNTEFDLYFTDLMLEEGNAPTPWSPAPEDTQDQIDQANINISNKVDQNAYNTDQITIWDSINSKMDDAEFREFQTVMNNLKSSYDAFVGEGGRYEKELQNASKREQAIIQDFGEKVQQFNFINTYIRESEEGIVIGAKGNPMQMLLSKDSLSFMDGGQVVAYFSNQSFYINRGAVVESLQVGVHKLTKIDNNHTVIQYIPQ
ncbi:collagen-like protein [Enterococcus cecorum]|uniref:collagen-like protein n=1 Tax=Enterococcus cecorum TaxID=44008 RepID=UPI001FAD1816|nr:collagen-like protein [Enterococcus cecorum]MCJ0596313.1 collagen-like protein [Enterococcus cecorum]